jgi:hypothetical protein
MIVLEVTSKKKPAKIIEKIKKMFGPDGYKLDMTTETDNSVVFEGGGGYFMAHITTKDAKAVVHLESREWEYQTKQMANKL